MIEVARSPKPGLSGLKNYLEGVGAAGGRSGSETYI